VDMKIGGESEGFLLIRCC